MGKRSKKRKKSGRIGIPRYRRKRVLAPETVIIMDELDEFKKMSDDKTDYVDPISKRWGESVMLMPKIGSITINCSLGQSGDPLERAKAILTQITGRSPVETIAKSTVREFNIRKFQPIGAKITIRGEEASVLLNRLFEAVNNQLSALSFDEQGNFGFGIKEHINIPGTVYDPNLGIIGFDVLVRMERPGYRVARRKLHRKAVSKTHLLNRRESIHFIQQNFNVEVIRGVVQLL
ncbi:MAG: 50S ribosomal protein L5 [Candidatus Kariarchaeaceae archaeon]